MKQSLHRLLFLLLFFIFIHSGKSGYSRSENGSINGVSAARSSCIFFAGKQWSACNPVISDYLSNLVINVKDANPSLNPDDNTSGYLKGPLWNWPQCRNYNGGSPEQPATTIYLGDNGTFGCDSWADVDTKYPKWQVVIHTAANIEAGLYGSWSGYSNVQHKTNTSPRFTSTGTWYWGMKVEYTDAGVTTGWYCNNDVNWSNMYGTPTSNLTVTVSALNNPSSQSAVLNGTNPSSQIDLSWSKDAQNHNVMIVRKLSGASWTEPAQGTTYTVGNSIGSGTVVHNSNGTSLTDDVSSSSTYDYKFYSENWGYYSSGVVTSSLTTNTAATDYFRSKTTGNWSATSSWQSSADNSNWVDATSVPGNTSNTTTIQNGHTITLTGSTDSKLLVINAGGTLNCDSQSLNFPAGASLTNNGTFTSGTGTVTFSGTGAITGTIGFNNVNISGAVNFGIQSIIYGTLKILLGGYVDINAPTYATGSLLLYSAGIPFDRDVEWSQLSGSAYPYNVQISNGTTLNMNVKGKNLERKIAGNLTIDAGSALDMQDMTIGTTDVGVTITGNIVNNGSILFSTTTERLKCTDFTSNSGASVTLSSNYPGDLEVAGNFTDAGTFNPNNRAVFFNGATGDQTITNSVGETFDYVIVDKATSGNVVLASPVTIRQKLTLTNGLIVTTATNILNVTNTLASAITGGSTSSYISGPVLWTLPASLVAGSTYTIPVGKGGVYLPMTVIDPTTGIGVINITAEAFNGDCGGSAGVGLTSLSATEYWSLQSSSINFTNHRISLTRQSAVSPFDRIGRSTTINGSYSSVGGTPSGNSINNSNNTAAGTSQYFVMAKAGPIIISGSVGVDGTYASLTNAAGAFAAINGTAQTGANILITINGDVTTESGTTSLTAGAWTTLTINPSGSRTISGTVADPLINLNGADNVTIDGLNTGGNLLTIANLSTSATAQTSTIRLIADATSNTITNCSILGSATVPLGTPGGNIFISTGFVTGNDNITISNCKIGPAGANLPSKGVFGNGSTVSVARANSNVTINNCEIYDFFLTSGCAGVYALTGNTVWSITNNKIYQAATRTFTAAGTMTGIYFADAGYGNNIQITGNTIGYASSTGTGTLNLTGSGFSGAFQGIYLSAFETATTCNINSNIISDISLTSLAGAFSGIYNATTLVASNTININSNQVKNIGLVTTTGTARGIYAGSATTLNCNSNTIDNLTRDEAGLFYGIQYASPNTITLNGNTVKNLSSTSTSTASASPFYGIYSGNNPTNENIIGNIICNLTSSSTSTALHYIIGLNSNTTTGIKNIQNNNIYNLSEATGSASIYGILLQLGTTSEISGNSVYSLSGGKNIYGISIWNNTVANRIFNNKIYDLSSSNGSATVYGIDLSGGTTNTVFNNLVGDLRAAGVTAAIPVIGIYASSLTTTNNIYYNTVYLNASSSGATFGSTACYASNAGTTTVNLRNNIFVNISTPNGATGYTSAYRRSGISLNPSYAVASNNNLFYAGTPGTYNLIMYDGTNSYQTLAAYKTAVGARRDSVSISENPNWVSTVGSNAAYLHINPAVLNHIESGAVNIATYTTDFDGNIRQGNFGYSGTGTAPDIGADEFETPPCAGAVGGTASGSATFCGSGTPSITAGGYSFGPGSTYQWQYSNNNFGSDIHDFAGQTNPDVLTTGMVSVTKYYRLKVTCSSGLATDYSTVVAITVNPIPTSSASSNTPPVCTGSTLFLTGSTNIGTVFNWTGPNGFTSTNQNPSIPSVTLDAAGVYSFTAIDNGCSSVVSSTTVIVNQSPSTLTISPAIDTLCIGSIQQLVVTGGTNAGVYRFGSATDTTEGNSFTSTLGPNPMQSFYGGSKQQMIFTAAELIAAGIPVGQFTALKVNLANGNDAYPLLNFTVKMGHTSAGSYATGSSWITGLTTVRNTASFSPQTGLNTLRFNTPFTWNGTSNIVVEMSYSNSNLGTNNNTNTATYSATPSASTLFYRALNTSFAVIDAYTSAASYMYNSRTDIAFLDSLPRSVVWTPIQGLYTNPTATTAYTPGTPLSTVYAKPTTTTTYTATSTSTAGCTSSNTSTITVYPLPTAAITSNANICPGCSVQLSVALTGTGPWTFTYTDGTTPVTVTTSANPYTFNVSPTVTTTYTITAVSGFGSCVGTITGPGATITTGPVEVKGSVGPTDAWYPTLKTAFDAINAGTHKGTIEVLIHGSTTETATAKLNDGVTLPASYTGITIYPTTTGLSISGSLAAPLIDLDGADNVTFDGRENGSGTPKALTIINTNPGSAASTSTIRFINDATSNVVQHCIIKGASTDPSGGVVFFSTTPLNINGTGNSQNLIQLNDITGVGTSRPVNTVYSYGFEARINIYDIIRNNNFYNFLNPAKSSGAITLADNNALWEITGNSFYETDTLVPSKDVEYHMIRIENSGAFYTVTGNYIGGSANSCGGSPLTKTNGGDNIFYGIYFNVNSDVNSGIISGNRIKNISWSNSGNATWTAINVVDGAVTVGGPNPSDGNMIGDTIGTGSIIVTNDTLSGNVIGIKTTSDKSISIQNNLIGSVTADNSIPDFSTSLWGILNEGINGVVSIADNRIGSDTTAQSIHAKSPSTAAQQTVYGIYNFTPCYLTVSGNRISHLLNASINDNGLINGIYVEEGSNKILNNSISNITIKGGIQVQWLSSVIGINLYNFFPDTNIVSGNTIYNLSNEGSGDIVSNVIGLYINAGSNPDINRIEKNFIHSLTNLSTNSGASITGVFIKDGNAVYQNNIVSIDLDTAGLLGYGFNVAKGTNDIYFNTVSLTGENAGNDIAITMHNDPVSGNIGNNIFSNACSGSGTHRSIFIDVLNSCNIDYNDYIGKDTLTHGVSGPNCVTTPPRFPNAVGTALVDYIPQADTLAGDTLLMVTITDDIDGDARCLPTMGAQEYDTAVATPVFDLGPTSTRCVGIDTILYHATARRARTLIYSLDTASLAIGYKIDTLTGLVYYTTAYIDTTVITATATGCGGPKTATHTVTIIHSTQDFTIPASPQSYCVQNIDTATYYDPLMDITPLRPDYYTFVQGDTLLDISVANNPCCATQNTIHWRIDFMDTYNPSDSSVVHTPPVSGTGQPSEHTTDIQLPGDGVYFNDITHTITYWLVDCKGNISATKTVDIVIKPRPNVIKN